MFCKPMRRISPAHHSAQRFTSPACCGSALMLGIASRAFSSSRYRSRFTLMKSMILPRSMIVSMCLQSPSVEVVERALFHAQLLEVRPDVFPRRGHQGGVEAMIDAIRDGLHGRVA